MTSLVLNNWAKTDNWNLIYKMVCCKMVPDRWTQKFVYPKQNVFEPAHDKIYNKT